MLVDNERINRNKKLMRDQGFDALICRLPENVVFFSGWWPLTGTSWIIYTADGQSHLIVPKCELQEAGESGISELSVFEWGHLGAKDALEEMEYAFQAAIKKIGIERGIIGIEESFEGIAPPLNIAEPSIPGKWSKEFLQKIFPQAKFKDASGIINDLRRQKTKIEIEKFRIVNEIAGFGLNAFRNQTKQDISEIEIAATVNSIISIKGSGYKGIKSARGFAQISSGLATEKAWRPCVVTTNRMLQHGDIVLLELAVVADGYWADNTRTVIVGVPNEIQKKVYNVVLESQLAAKSAIKPGIPMNVVDKAARKIIEQAGYGKFFIHITGHGVGWRYHEPSPILSPGNEDLLEEGMVTSVEPGIYIPGLGGFRVEDNVVVTENGFEDLSTFNRNL